MLSFRVVLLFAYIFSLGLFLLAYRSRLVGTGVDSFRGCDFKYRDVQRTCLANCGSVFRWLSFANVAVMGVNAPTWARQWTGWAPCHSAGSLRSSDQQSETVSR